MSADPLVYGRDDEERIVGVHIHDDSSVRVYTRLSPTKVTSRVEPFKPFCFVTDRGLAVVQQDYLGYSVHPLKGRGVYRHLLVFEDWRSHWTVVNALRKDEDLKRDVYYVASPQSQYLMQTGKTLFMGMTSNDVVRWQVDIETLSSRENSFSNAEREGDAICIISISDNHGFEKVLRLVNPAVVKGAPCEEEVFEDEADLLSAFVREVHRRDPDVMELHNGFGFDLPYMMARAKRNGISFAIGRDRKPPRAWPSQKKFAERDFDYTNVQPAGRAVIDTLFFSAEYDVFTRELPNLTLKGVADHFRKADGVTYEQMHGVGRTYVDGADITRLWHEDPDTLLAYAMDDVRETRYLADKLSGATFYLTQMLPLTYQEAHLAGSGRTIESMMVRWYLTKMTALPQPETGRQEWGGYTDIFYTGRFRNIVYADVASLYPSIMLKYHCHPESDELGAHRGMLTTLKALRLKVKAEAGAAKEAGDSALAGVLKATEQSYKVIINSAYGVMGDSFSLFNDFSEADRVARTGQQLLKRMLQIVRYHGGTVIECDTDGVLFVAPEHMHGDQEAQKALVKQISAEMPEGIDVDMDGLFDVMISVAKKNYALRGYDGKVKLKGGAFKSRGLEGFGRQYLSEQLDPLMDGNVQRMFEIHRDYKDRLVARRFTIRELESRATLKDSIDTYEEKVENGNNRAAQYELAIKLAERSGRRAQKGDTIRYYIAGSKPAYKVTGFLDGRLSDDYTEGSENVRHYLARLQTFADRFAIFFSPEDFARIFSKTAELSGTGDLFGGVLPDPDFSGVEIVNRVATVLNS